MDRDQHITQDAAEHYAVYVMARTAEELGRAASSHSASLHAGFLQYLADRNWDFTADFAARYPDYKLNVDRQIPNFVKRICDEFPQSKFQFAIDEANFRAQGLKADFTISASSRTDPYMVSLKNYVGVGGILRPQVSSGTFLSFAAGFVFERSGVGVYEDPRRSGKTFKGSVASERDAVLQFQHREGLIAPLRKLEELQQHVREELLQLHMYDQAEVKRVVQEIVPSAQTAMLDIFGQLGLAQVRKKFLERIGFDGAEDLLYFDGDNFVDSLTSRKFHELLDAINSPETEFKITPTGQSLRFEFSRDGMTVLSVDVPLTVNTNGAWHRPKEKYEGTQIKNDKGTRVALRWGQIRPAKSKEIATSTNSYVNLQATGIFDN